VHNTSLKLVSRQLTFFRIYIVKSLFYLGSLVFFLVHWKLSGIGGYLKLVLKVLLRKCLLIMPIFLEAAGVLKLNSHWSKGFINPPVQSQKSFRKLLVGALNEGFFRKALMLTVFRRFRI
jgi:hypothetical protein